MLGMTATLPVFVALSALVLAVASIGWAVKLNKRLSGLGRRVLESTDTAKILAAAEKAGTIESRLTACEDRTNQNQNQLSEHGTRLGELAANLDTTGQTANRNQAGLSDVSEKVASFESRIGGCENRAEQSQNQILDHEMKVNELTARLEAAEMKANELAPRLEAAEMKANELAPRLEAAEMKANELAARLEPAERKLDEHEAGLAEANRSTNVLADEIRGFEEFQTATEKARSLILAAFNDMQTHMPPAEGFNDIRPSMSPGEGLDMGMDAPAPEETSQEPDEGQSTY